MSKLSHLNKMVAMGIEPSTAEKIRTLTGRLHGATLPELCAELSINRDAGRNLLRKLIGARLVRKTTDRRRRDYLFGESHPGAGGFVYRAFKESRDLND